MPTGQQYATNVPQTTLTGSVNASATSLSVASSASWPSVPFTAVLDIGTSTQEPVDVTAVVGTTWTVTRNIDSTTGFSHAIGATVTHANIGRDFREARSHIDASAAVHGLTGTVVGTSDSQTLTNKTVSGPTLSFTGLTGAVNGTTRLAGQTAGGPPTTGTFVTGDLVSDPTYDTVWFCTTGGTPGTWIAVSDPTDVKTFTGGTSFTYTIPAALSAAGANLNTLVIDFAISNSAAGGETRVQVNGNSGANYAFANIVNSTGTAAPAGEGVTSATSWRVGVPSGITTTKPGTMGRLVFPYFTLALNAWPGAYWDTTSQTNAAVSNYRGSGTFSNSGALTSVTLLMTSGTISSSVMTARYLR